MSKENSILFFSYWYPNKISPIFPVFIKKHAQSIKLQNNIVVLSLSIINGSFAYKKNVDVIMDEHGIETHQVYLESKFYKLLYICLPLHHFILKCYIKKSLLPIYKFEVIHSNILFPCGIVGSWLARSFKCKHVITEHWSRLDTFFTSNFYRRAGRKALREASAITCVSGLLQTTLKKYTRNKNLVIIPNVIDEREFYYDPPTLPHGLTFMAAANWTPPKNIFYFLNALEQLLKEKKLPPFRLILAGNGKQMEGVQDQYSFPIECPGVVGPKELRTLFNRTDIFLHGSEYETFSTVIAEALMCGVPSVVSPVGIAGEVINSSNGFITNNTHEDWMNKILQCYETSYDRSAISLQLKNKYDIVSVGNTFTTLYKKIS